MREPVLEGVSIDTVPAVGLSENPVKTEPELSSKQPNPTPSAISWYMAHSVHPNQAYAHQHRRRKEPIYGSAFGSPRLKQRMIPIASHLSPNVSVQCIYDQLQMYCGGILIYSNLRNLVVLPAIDFVRF